MIDRQRKRESDSNLHKAPKLSAYNLAPPDMSELDLLICWTASSIILSIITLAG